MFGGGSKSSSTQLVTTNNDNSNQQAGQLAIKGDGNTSTVNVLDGGAIADSFEFAESVSEKTLEFADSASQNANSLASNALKAVKENTSESVNKFASLAEAVKTDGQAQTTKMIGAIVVSLVAAGVAIAWILTKNKAAA
jgi:hypothetical protein